MSVEEEDRAKAKRKKAADEKAKPSSSITTEDAGSDLFTKRTRNRTDFTAGTRDTDASDIRNAIDDPDFARARDAQTSAINVLTYGSPFQSLPGGMFAPTAEGAQIAGGLVGQAIPTVAQAQAGDAAQMFGPTPGLERASPYEIDYGPKARTPGEQSFWDSWMNAQNDYLASLAEPTEPAPSAGPSMVPAGFGDDVVTGGVSMGDQWDAGYTMPGGGIPLHPRVPQLPGMSDPEGAPRFEGGGPDPEGGTRMLGTSPPDPEGGTRSVVPDDPEGAPRQISGQQRRAIPSKRKVSDLEWSRNARGLGGF